MTPLAYDGLDQEINDVEISYMNCISEKTQIYSIGLIYKFQSLRYKGYTDLRQLGQYHSFTMKGTVTRLYTVVNFLNKANITRMTNLMKISRDSDFQRITGHKRPVEAELSSLKSLTTEVRQKLLA